MARYKPIDRTPRLRHTVPLGSAWSDPRGTFFFIMNIGRILLLCDTMAVSSPNLTK